MSMRKACNLLGVSRNNKREGKGTSPAHIKSVQSRIARLERSLEDTGSRQADQRLLTLSHMGHVAKLFKLHQADGILASQQAVMSLLLLAAVKFVWRLQAHVGTWLISVDMRTRMRSMEGVEVRLVTNASPLWTHSIRLWCVPGTPAILFRLQRNTTSGEEMDVLLEGEMSEIACEKMLALFNRDRKNDERQRQAQAKKMEKAVRASYKRKRKSYEYHKEP